MISAMRRSGAERNWPTRRDNRPARPLCRVVSISAKVVIMSSQTALQAARHFQFFVSPKTSGDLYSGSLVVRAENSLPRRQWDVRSFADSGCEARSGCEYGASMTQRAKLREWADSPASLRDDQQTGYTIPGIHV